MTMYDLIHKLTEMAEELGYDCQVIEMDGEGEFPFCVRLELEQYQWKPKLTIGIDTSGNGSDVPEACRLDDTGGLDQ